MDISATDCGFEKDRVTLNSIFFVYSPLINQATFALVRDKFDTYRPSANQPLGSILLEVEQGV